MLNFCIKLSVSVTQNRSSLSLLTDTTQPNFATENDRQQWLPYLNQAAGKTLPNLEFSLSTSTVRQSALGSYHVVFFAIPIDYHFTVCMQFLVSCLDSDMYSRAAQLVIATLNTELESFRAANQCADAPANLVGEIADLQHELYSAWEAHDIIEASGKRATSRG